VAYVSAARHALHGERDPRHPATAAWVAELQTRKGIEGYPRTAVDLSTSEAGPRAQRRIQRQATRLLCRQAACEHDLRRSTRDADATEARHLE